MKEIRIHGIGGMGTVKSGEIIAHAAVMNQKYGSSTPFFGFERQGAPVSSFVRLSDEKIRPKNQVYTPDCVIVMDPSLMVSGNVFEGLKEDGLLIINMAGSPEKLLNGKRIGSVGYVDATGISLEAIGRAIPNTVMLGAFTKMTGWVRKDIMEERILELFGENNVKAFSMGYDSVVILA